MKALDIYHRALSMIKEMETLNNKIRNEYVCFFEIKQSIRVMLVHTLEGIYIEKY